MFTRSNASIINLDKQINKTTDKCLKLEDEIAKNKNYLETKQHEIDQIAFACDNVIEERAAIEQDLLSIGFTVEQLHKIHQPFHIQVDQHSNSSLDDLTKTSSKNSSAPKSPMSKTNNNLIRTSSKRSNDHIVVSSL